MGLLAAEDVHGLDDRVVLESLEAIQPGRDIELDRVQDELTDGQRRDSARTPDKLKDGLPAGRRISERFVQR